MPRVAVIGGTGLYDHKVFEGARGRRVRTPYGSVEAVVGRLKGREVVFLPRHGKGHANPPHRVNYLANIYALKELEVTRVIATNSVGGINTGLRPGDAVIPNDFVDLTRGRAGTFYDEEVVHIDLSTPYCPEVRRALIGAAKAVLGRAHEGVYACMEGPRFETPAEIRMLRALGCDVVGMTGCPETALARELELCYASVCTVTNYAAGLGEERLTAADVLEVVRRNEENLREVLVEAIEKMPEERSCGCGKALTGARMK